MVLVVAHPTFDLRSATVPRQRLRQPTPSIVDLNPQSIRSIWATPPNPTAVEPAPPNQRRAHTYPQPNHPFLTLPSPPPLTTVHPPAPDPTPPTIDPLDTSSTPPPVIAKIHRRRPDHPAPVLVTHQRPSNRDTGFHRPIHSSIIAAYTPRRSVPDPSNTSINAIPTGHYALPHLSAHRTPPPALLPGTDQDRIPFDTLTSRTRFNYPSKFTPLIHGRRLYL